jgi:hypothetical protein
MFWGCAPWRTLEVRSLARFWRSDVGLSLLPKIAPNKNCTEQNGSPHGSQKVSPPSLKNRRNSEGPGSARRVSRVLADFWSGFPGRMGPFEFTKSRPPATDAKAEIFDMLAMAATPRPSCADIDVGKLHVQDTDGRSRAPSKVSPSQRKTAGTLKDREAHCAPPPCPERLLDGFPRGGWDLRVRWVSRPRPPTRRRRPSTWSRRRRHRVHDFGKHHWQDTNGRSPTIIGLETSGHRH